MIRAVLAILRITLRQTWSSRSILWLAMAALVPAALFPHMIKGDGTPTGAYTMLMTYAPVALFAVLLTGSIWLGAFALATERLQLQFSMLKTKPVRGWAIWLGKWLGVCTINLMILTLSGLTFMLMLHLRSDTLVPGSHAFWLPHPPDEQEIWQEARRIQTRRQSAHQTNDVPSAIPPLQHIVNRLRQQRYRVPPGGKVTWRIPLPEPLPAGQPWRLSYRWRLDPMRRTPVRGTWSLEHHTIGKVLATRHVANLLDGNHALDFGILDLPRDIRDLTLRFDAAPDHEPDIFFDSKSPIRLQQQAGSRTSNLLRAAGIMLIFAAAVAAMALALSACLSFPVAVFTTHGILLALLIAGVAGQADMLVRHDHGHAHGHSDGWLLQHSTHFLDTVHAHTVKLREVLPFQELPANLQIPYRGHARTLLLLGVVLPLLCAGISHTRIQHGEVPQ